MGENTIELTSENFDEKIKTGKWIVDFWAEWCGPCKMLSPIFDECGKEFKGRVSFGKVNIEKDGDLAERFEVMSIPTMIMIKDGEVVNRFTGLMPKEDLLEEIDSSF